MDSVVLDVDTRDRRVVDVTALVREFCDGRSDGLCNVFVPHATAGIAIMETGASSEADLVDALERLLPRRRPLPPRGRIVGHGADHVMPAIVAPSVSVPVLAGEPALGVWQSIVLVDLNRDNSRRHLRLSFVAG